MAPERHADFGNRPTDQMNRNPDGITEPCDVEKGVTPALENCQPLPYERSNGIQRVSNQDRQTYVVFNMSSKNSVRFWQADRARTSFRYIPKKQPHSKQTALQENGFFVRPLPTSTDHVMSVIFFTEIIILRIDLLLLPPLASPMLCKCSYPSNS